MCLECAETRLDIEQARVSAFTLNKKNAWDDVYASQCLADNISEYDLTKLTGDELHLLISKYTGFDNSINHKGYLTTVMAIPDGLGPDDFYKPENIGTVWTNVGMKERISKLEMPLLAYAEPGFSHDKSYHPVVFNLDKKDSDPYIVCQCKDMPVSTRSMPVVFKGFQGRVVTGFKLLKVIPPTMLKILTSTSLIQ